MDIDYHYFVVKTLAQTAGFSEEDAQTVAYYSQQVDNFTKCLPMEVRQEPPAYFFEKKYAVKKGEALWRVMPHPTGIDVIQSLEKHYRHTTLAPFHFIPAKPFSELETEPNFTRVDYRCVRADDKRAELINRIVEEAVEAVLNEKSEKSLMQLGMALHTYADTYAHCGYSGLDGWENQAVIKKAFNQETGKEEVSAGERLVYNLMPHIGHGNSGHVPDVCTYQIDVAMRKEEEDHAHTQHIVRDNLKDFLDCAKAILKLLSRAAQTEAYEKTDWDKLQAKLAEGMQVVTEDENKEKKLAEHWSTVFPEITYAYDKNERFYQSQTDELGVYDVTDAFYMYNELAYRRAELVVGTEDLLVNNAQMLTEEQTEPVAARNMTEEPASAQNMTENRAELTANKNSICDGNWEPQSELGLAVYTAGFAYEPEKDIICSTMNNAQRMAGYCKGYDESAVAIDSVIDGEPIYFCYDGYEWMIELWKGQYNIGTGCEIGIYYREQDKPLSAAEKTVLGKFYSCVPDERMLDLRFALEKDGEELFARDWAKHWWLTGFYWGIQSEPEQLAMMVGIRFPNREMEQAFVHQGLESMGYEYTETDDCTVEFTFEKVKTQQPAVRDAMRKEVQLVNCELIKTYNNIRKKYGIPNNDPNVISQVINERAGIAEKKLCEKLIHYFNRKAKRKEEAQKAHDIIA